ncbi:MAG TPA: fumarylacetoacetate hydrolase family protein [Steroidobacteraceae bacterium]|nr:fumarylacetoacetate hydrolase family protein [Steroidobacteraceae bacterium]
MALCKIPMDVAPYGLSGTVYGTLLNHRTAFAALAGQMTLPPYNAPPRAPVLYLKPRNTLAAGGDIVEVPAATPELEAAACLGIVIGRTACNITEAHALDHVAGFLIVNDVSIPHPDYYRPSVRYKARDGFCPLGPRVTARALVADPDALAIRTHVDGVLVQTMSTAELIRSVARLLAEVTEFMTLAPGDVLAAGAAAPAPRVRAGQTVTMEADALGTLINRFAAAA